MSATAPISIPPSSFWDGNDGLWNTFIVEVGTPPQSFRVLPSSSGQETWIIDPEGCSSDDPPDCPFLRGTQPFDGRNSTGFNASESNTWDALGLYSLVGPEEEVVGIQGNGAFGFDTVDWGGQVGSSQRHQIVASIADTSVFLGILGLDPEPSNFSNYNQEVPSFLSTLVANNTIPSTSWAYTAGAAYRDKAPASLVLGGYDSNRFKNFSGPMFAMNADNSRPLQVGLTKILGTNTLNGTLNLLPEVTYHFVDSMVPHIWVPASSIDLWVGAFGLTYDSITDLYLVNDTIRSQLQVLNPSVTFFLANSTTNSDLNSVSIELPYSAFDCEASWPYYDNATRYFPIRKAYNSTQYSLGRTFWQEAYVIADFDRNNFTVAQAKFDSLNTSNIIPIYKPTNANTTGTSDGETESTHHGLSKGAIGGIVAGACVAIIIAFLVAFACYSRKKRNHNKGEESTPEKAEPPRLDSAELAEGSTKKDRQHINEYPVGELGPQDPSEVHGDTRKWGQNGVQEIAGKAVDQRSSELCELPAEEPVRDFSSMIRPDNDSGA